MAASTAPKKKKSGNPAKVNTGRNWKRNKGEELTLPSGNTALVKRPGPAALLSDGLLPDTLMPIVQQAITKGKGLRPQDTAKMIEDPAAIAGMLDSMDRLMVKVVVAPTVAYHKCWKPAPDAIGGVTLGQAYGAGEWQTIDDEQRDGATTCSWCSQVHPDGDEVIYSDEVDLDDKMFIFQYAVGGTRDLERFRSEHAAGMGDISDGSGDESTPESTD